MLLPILSKTSFYFMPVWIRRFARLRLQITFRSFFFFWFQSHYFTKSTVNSARMHCSWVPQIPLFSHFFIKNGSHGTIHTFKNDFATMFSVLVFSFSKNKLNSNGPFIFASNVYIAANVKLVYSIFWFSSSIRAYFTSQFFLFGWLMLLNSKC